MERNNELIIKPYTHKELAILYGVSWVTFLKWVKPLEVEIGPKLGHFYNSRQIEIIFQKLGVPRKYIKPFSQ